MPDDLHKHRRWGDGRVDPDDLVPEDEEEAAGPGAPDGDVVVRALSVIPFLLVAALGLLSGISWVLILVFGLGSGQPIWQTVQDLSAAALLWQLFLAVLIGLLCIAVTLVASWATTRGFREDSSRAFWTVTQGLWGLAVIGIVYVWRSPPDWFAELGLTTTDWWFTFGVVAFAMILAGVRLRRAPRSG